MSNAVILMPNGNPVELPLGVMRVSSASNRRGTVQNEMVAHLVVKFWLPSIELLRVGFTACEFSCWAACSVYGINWDFHRHFLRLEWNARHDLFVKL